MIDAYEDDSPFRISSLSNNELTLAAIKEYLLSKGGKVKYSELFSHFKEQIVDSTTGFVLKINTSLEVFFISF